MTHKDRDLLIRIDERLKSLHDKVDVVIGDNTEQWKKINVHEQKINKHQTYFKMAGYVIGASGMLGILAKAVSAILQ